MALNPPYTMEAMQCYIKYARAIKPRITQQVRVHLQREAQKGIKAASAPGPAPAVQYLLSLPCLIEPPAAELTLNTSKWFPPAGAAAAGAVIQEAARR